MKTRAFLLLVSIMTLFVFCANAENWICPSCGNSATGNFCNNCGASKPSSTQAGTSVEVTFFPGFYVVGQNIKAGSYRINVGEECYGMIYKLFPSMQDFLNKKNQINRFNTVVYGGKDIAGVQRQRDYQFAQGFSHKVSL